MTYIADDPTKIIPPTHTENNTILNSGTTGNFTQDDSVWMNHKLTKYPLSVTLLDGSQIKLTHTAILSLQNLPEAARREHIYTKLKPRFLISVIQLFNQGCTVNFTSDQVSVNLDKQTILTGPNDNNMGLWTVPLANPSPTQPKPWLPPPNTCQYTHAIQTVQPPSVIHQAANNEFDTKNINIVSVPYTRGMPQTCSIPSSWPELTVDLVTKHLLKSQATAKGYLQQQRKQLWSTKKQLPKLITPDSLLNNKLTP